jgi:hypothetical protein
MSRRTPTLVLAGLAVFATMSLTACGGSLDGSAHSVAPAASSASTTVTASATPSATASAAPAPAVAAPAVPAVGVGTGRGAGTGGGAVPAPAPAGSGGGSNTGGGGGSNNGGGSGSGGGPTAPSPKITKFVISKQPSCPVNPNSNPGHVSSPGNDVTISWTVTGADGAAIAVDNPDTYAAYGMYGSSGSLTLPFGCTDGTTTTHTYTVWPAGAKNVSKTISASAHSDN